MVSGFCPVFGIMGSYDGSHDICQTSVINTSSALHSSIFWLHHLDVVFQSWSKSTRNSQDRVKLIKYFTAWEYDIDLIFGFDSVGMSDMVPCQLLSHG